MALLARSHLAARGSAVALLCLACGGSRPAPGADGAAGTETAGSGPEGRTELGGGQTTDFGGVELGCRVVDSEAISVEAARARGFPVEADLARLQGRFEVEWQRRPSSCADTRPVSGTLVIQSELAGIYVDRHESEPGADCPDALTYVARVALTSSDGVISGSFEARGRATEGELLMGALADGRSFGGWLGIRVDGARPHSSGVNFTFGALPGGVAGSLYPQATYADGQLPALHTGEVIIWPPQMGDVPCSASPEEPGDGSVLMALDEYLSRD